MVNTSAIRKSATEPADLLDDPTASVGGGDGDRGGCVSDGVELGALAVSRLGSSG
jgi:hypothetical protein